MIVAVIKKLISSRKGKMLYSFRAFLYVNVTICDKNHFASTSLLSIKQTGNW